MKITIKKAKKKQFIVKYHCTQTNFRHYDKVLAYSQTEANEKFVAEWSKNYGEYSASFIKTY